MNSFHTSGVCAKKIEFTIENDLLTEVKFHSGCPGNLMGIERLVEGLHIDEVITRLKGIGCGSKSTSCPDQLALALEGYKTTTAVD